MPSARLRSCVFFLVLFFVPASVFAQQKKGEIINVNYKYKIAFTDLTEGDIQPGSKVRVALSDGREVALQVLEAYPVMAKLTSPVDPAGTVSDEDFAKISVGAAVFAFSQGKPLVHVKPVVQIKPVEVLMKQVPSSRVLAVSERSEEVRAENKPLIVKKPVVDTAMPVTPVNVESPPDPGSREVAISEKVEKLTANTINLSEHIARLLTDKGSLELVLKEKEAAFVDVKKKADEMTAANAALDAQVKALQAEVNRLKVANADGQKSISDLEQKLSELKKKLARMVDIVNKNIKSYE